MRNDKTDNFFVKIFKLNLVQAVIADLFILTRVYKFVLIANLVKHTEYEYSKQNTVLIKVMT